MRELTLKNRPEKFFEAMGDVNGQYDPVAVDEYFKGFEKKFETFDAQKWFDKNVYDDWTCVGMLELFIKRQVLGESEKKP